MKRIAIVTDSTADLTDGIKKQFDVHVMPLKIHFSDEVFLDGELTSEAFYQRLAVAKELPKTSQPSPEDFISLYRQLLQKYESVISIHLSSALSGTVNSATIAAQAFQNKIHVVDSKNISLGIFLMVVEAINCIRAEMDIQMIMERLQAVRNNIETVFTLNTLEYLQKGGRIGKVAGYVGSLLNIKPIIRVNDEGIYVPAGKARSQSKALEEIVQNMVSRAGGRRVKTLAVAHGAALDAAMKLKTSLESAIGVPVTIFTHVGAVIGVHTGPGTVGAAMQYE